MGAGIDGKDRIGNPYRRDMEGMLKDEKTSQEGRMVVTIR
jgi:hypothetical protein